MLTAHTAPSVDTVRPHLCPQAERGERETRSITQAKRAWVIDHLLPFLRSRGGLAYVEDIREWMATLDKESRPPAYGSSLRGKASDSNRLWNCIAVATSYVVEGVCDTTDSGTSKRGAWLEVHPHLRR